MADVNCEFGYRTSVIQELPEPFYGTQYQRNQGITMYGMDSPQQQIVGWHYPTDYDVAHNLHYARRFPYENEHKSCNPCDNELYWISSQSYDCERTSGWNHSDNPPIPKLTIRPVKPYPETDMQGRRGSSNHYGYSLGRGPLSRRGHHSRPFPSPRPPHRGRGRPVGRPRGNRTRGERPSREIDKETNSPGEYRSSDNDDISALKTKCVIPNQQNDLEITTQALRETHNVENDIIKVNPSVPKNIDILCSPGMDGLEDSMSMKENSVVQRDSDTILLENSSKWTDNMDEIECEFDSTTNYYDTFAKLRQTRISLNNLPLSSDKLEVALQKMYPDMFPKHIQVKVEKLQSSNPQESEINQSCASSLSSITDTPSPSTTSINFSETMSCSHSPVDNSVESASKTNLPTKDNIQYPKVAVTSSAEDSKNKSKITHVPHFNISKLKSKLKSVKIPGPPTQQSIETQTDSFALESPEIPSVSSIPPRISDESPSLINVSEESTNDEDSSQLLPPILEPIDYAIVNSRKVSVDLATTEIVPPLVVLDDAKKETDNKTDANPGDVSSLTVIMVETKESFSDSMLDDSLCAEHVIELETVDSNKDNSQGYINERDSIDPLTKEPDNETENISKDTQQFENFDQTVELDEACDGSSATGNHGTSITPDTKEQFSESVIKEAMNAEDKMNCDETMNDKPKEVDEQISASSEVDSNIISTDCNSVPIPTQNTEGLGDDSVGVKCDDSVDVKCDDSVESPVLSNMDLTNLEDAIMSNMESVGAEEYVVANTDFIGAEEHIESDIESTEKSVMDSKNGTNVISLVTITVETSDDRINKAEAESAVKALFSTNNQTDKYKYITTKETRKNETNYDSDASDATVRYSDDEDHHSLKIDIPLEDDDEKTKDPAEDDNDETIDTLDTVSCIIPQNIPVDTKLMDDGENESCRTDPVPDPSLELTADDPQKTAGKRKTREKNNVTLNKTTKREDIKTPALRQKRKYVRKVDTVSKKTHASKTKEEKLTLTISRSPRKKLKESPDTDIIDHPGKSVCANDNENRKPTRSKHSVNGRNVSRRMHSRKPRLTVTKKRKRGKKNEVLDFPDIKRIIEGGADKSDIDEDELPTILPPKRRRVNSKGTLKSKTTVSDMDRLVQEFPRHNWLENKYKKEEDLSDNQDKGAMLEPNGDSPKLPDNDIKSGVDTTDMEVSTTTAVDENIDNECPNPLREDTVTSERTREAEKDDISTNENIPLDLCVKPSPGQKNQQVGGIQVAPKETSDLQPCLIKTADSELSDLSCKAKDGDHLDGSDVKHLQGNNDLVNLSCITSSTTATESSGQANASPVTISNTLCISSTINSDSALQVANTVSSTSPAVISSQERGVPENLASIEVMENLPNKTNVSDVYVTQNTSHKSKEFDKEVYKHLREYRQIQEREARMAQERAELIRLKNEKANLLRQLGIQRKPRSLKGSSLGIRPIDGDPNQIFAVNLATTSHEILPREKQSKCQSELLGKINNALRYRKTLGHSPRLTQQRLTDHAGNPAPAHMTVRENIVELSQEIEKCKVQKPAHIDITGPFMKRKDPLTRPPFEFSTRQPSKSMPPHAHSQTPFQSAGQLIYPLPSFLEHKAKLNRKLQPGLVKEGSVSTNANTSVSSPCVKRAEISETENKQSISSEISLKANVQSERQQEIKPCPPSVSTSVDQKAKITASSCTSVQTETTKQSQSFDKHQDTEMVVQRELNEALAKRQKFDDPENATQKSKTDQSRIPNSYTIDPKLFQSIQESAQKKIKEAERKQQQYTQRVNQQQARQNLLKIQQNSQQIRKDLIARQQQDQQMFQKHQQQQRQQPQQFARQVQQHIQQQQQLQWQQQTLQQQKRQQQKQQPQPQANIMQQVQHQTKTQVIQQTTQPTASQGIFPSAHLNINSSQGQIHPQVVSSGQSRFMTPYSCQNVNPIIQTQLANRLRVPVNITSQSSNNITTPAGQSRESGSQDQLLVLQRPHAATATMPQSNTVDQSQRVLVGAITVNRGTDVSGFVPNVNDTSDKNHRPSVPEATDIASETRFSISFHRTDSHGQVAVQQNTAINSRYPVVTAHQHRNAHVHVETTSSNTSLPQSNVTQHHQQRQPNARPEVVGRVPSTVHAALQNNPTTAQSNNTGKIMNYVQMHASPTVQQSPRYSRDLPTTSTYSSSVVVQRETPPQLQQINGNCKVCGKSAMFLCSSCKLVWYCSQTCQLNHWVSHTHECKS